MWIITGWIHNKRRNRLGQPNVEKVVRDHGNLVLRKVILISRQQKVSWDSQTHISEPDRHTNEEGVKKNGFFFQKKWPDVRPDKRLTSVVRRQLHPT